MRPPENIDLASCAIFLDFDGTLAEIAPLPQDASVMPATIATLRALHHAAGGALAIVSGRSIDQIDAMLAPLVLPTAGIHGAIWRNADGLVRDQGLDERTFGELADRAEHAVASKAGIIVERKASAVAIHYRACPEFGAFCRSIAHHLAHSVPGLTCQIGKMVVEILPSGVHKGRAIKSLLTESPFAGRRPIFAGDDVTDEHGFAAVEEMGGIAVKIGDGHTSARYRLQSPADLMNWLQALMLATNKPGIRKSAT